MFRILKLVLLAAAVSCAPATLMPLVAPIAQPYFFVAQPQSQPLLKIQTPAAPETTKSEIEPAKGQYVFFYPSAPQLPLFALRQDEGQGSVDYWQEINNWFMGLSSSFTQYPSPEEPPSESAGTSENKMDKFMMEKKTMQPLMPASTMPLGTNKQRFLIVNSLPQFYGNFAAFPANPVVAIAPLTARSAVGSIPAEHEKVEQIRSADMIESVQQPAAVQTIQPFMLRSSIAEPVQRLEIDQPQIPIVNNEPVPEVAAQEIARFLNEARSQNTDTNAANDLSENDANKLRAKEESLEEETSIAQAKPSAIAVSGKAGISSSAPIATAVVGDGGLASASPSAIALSGDFEDDEKKLKAIQTEPFAPL